MQHSTLSNAPTSYESRHGTRVSRRGSILMVGLNQGWQKRERARTVEPTLSKSLLCRRWGLTPMWRQIWRTYYIIPKLFRHLLFFPMVRYRVCATKRVLGKCEISQEPEGGMPTLVTICTLSGSLSEIAGGLLPCWSHRRPMPGHR
jgi:hypothetical protein